MFKRRGKNGGSGVGRRATIGSLLAGIGGLLGRLVFWRKRKAS